MRRIAVAVVVVSAALLAACSSSGSAKAPPTSAAVRPTTTTAIPPNTPGGAHALSGTLWSLRSVGTKTIPASVDVTATFQRGTVSGSSGCNTYRASYTADGPAMTIGAVATTQIACPPPQMPIERAYLAALPKVRRYEIAANGSLTLKLRDSRTLVYVEQEQTVVGSWNVTGYLEQHGDAFASVLAGTTVTARFDTLDKVSGSDGCNQYGGPFRVQGSTIAMGPFGGTLKLCGADGVSSQANDFLAAMRAARTFTVSGTTLTLFDGQHLNAVTMTRAPSS